ncbi:hypothetical protein DFJ67_4025 [Asanoa ferruginea]|uniref:Uncharacterized protein n=1 Tax=Asanoa ferruginea TaxID=53367 RepID=A0A3D9ZKS3_9ACTN|nr:hypothetical protein [Asanoa ferruginea]REF98016.1 hypothetical protein DFJ67_4025 [Asanoa ferruginea]GIF49692.1 hypothetical protein Afe04nite_42310 [Asanoa ferruginea]
MLRVLLRVMDVLWAGLEFVRDLLFDFATEILIALAACGLLALGWWGFRAAPYPTLSIAAGVLLFAGYGVIAYLRDVRGTRLASRLGGAGLVAAAIVGILATYLPSCACLG